MLSVRWPSSLRHTMLYVCEELLQVLRTNWRWQRASFPSAISFLVPISPSQVMFVRRKTGADTDCKGSWVIRWGEVLKRFSLSSFILLPSSFVLSLPLFLAEILHRLYTESGNWQNVITWKKTHLRESFIQSFIGPFSRALCLEFWRWVLVHALWYENWIQFWHKWKKSQKLYTESRCQTYTDAKVYSKMDCYCSCSLYALLVKKIYFKMKREWIKMIYCLCHAAFTRSEGRDVSSAFGMSFAVGNVTHSSYCECIVTQTISHFRPFVFIL